MPPNRTPRNHIQHLFFLGFWLLNILLSPKKLVFFSYK
ncbi:putative membrane protein [Chlamydia muridarum]|nr:putative membrane protein [Chlamydia muridarum]KDU83151.1 putative membrane protein [Chlamydia muridarum]